MTRRDYAHATYVPAAQTRGQIQKLLEQWGCRRIAFCDDYDDKTCEIQFVWIDHEANQYAARFKIALTNDVDRTENQKDQRIRSRFRVLHLWLKASLNAVEAEIITAEELFLPWLSGPDGRTVAEVLLPRLNQLPTGGVRSLLGDGK